MPPIERAHGYKARAVCYTLNNYTPAEIDAYQALPGLSYHVYGKEVGEEGTPHLQGYCYSRHPKTFSAWRAFLPRAHIGWVISTNEIAIAYCKKDGDIWEQGVPPVEPRSKGEREKARWENTWENAKSGDIENIDADIRVRQYPVLKRIAVDYMAPVARLDGPCGIWIYGASGAGKSLAAANAFPEAYPKSHTNKWWDGYQNEPVVICDDIDKYDVALGGSLKLWADGYPFIAEQKGSSKKIRPSKFIVTSQYTIDEIWDDAATRDALNRRFVKIEKIAGQNIIL